MQTDSIGIKEAAAVLRLRAALQETASVFSKPVSCTAPLAKHRECLQYLTSRERGENSNVDDSAEPLEKGAEGKDGWHDY
ncbi:hypothetical protein EYF80_014270 [Liparis tanakae]|uniref:Uncharacterized protein n=1 Tax=Liparis tanakae TaxID=230148 RepID=A0A4Z2IBR9_9TELE|nr:hypothetical protein EYF80_014270 [Liparis tanakae]